jgi:aconitase B
VVGEAGITAAEAMGAMGMGMEGIREGMEVEVGVGVGSEDLFSNPDSVKQV